MSEKIMLTPEQVIVLLQRDDEYVAQLDTLRRQWHLPAYGFATPDLATWFSEHASDPLTQWEAEWWQRASIQPLNEIERQVAQLHRQYGFPPVLDRWMVQYLQYGIRWATQDIHLSVACDAEQKHTVAHGVGVYTEAGRLRQVNWCARFPVVDRCCQALRHACLVTFDLTPHDGDACLGDTAWIEPRYEESHHLPWDWHCVSTTMHRGMVYQVRCCIELRWPVDVSILQDARLDFEFVQPVKTPATHETQLPESPKKGAPHDDWFRWYHYITDELGFQHTLRDLAESMGFSHSHVKHLHADYQAEHKSTPE